MEGKTHTSGALREPIYTLGQSGTNNVGQPQLFVSGKGSDFTNKKVVEGRAKRKFITQTMSLGLVDIANERGASEQAQSYWNTYHCQSRVVSSNGRIYGNYCKNRYCTVCQSIRKAEIINKYLPVISSWPEPYFVTLTVKSCSDKKLKIWIDGMKRGFKKIKDKYRKRYERGTGPKFMGVKSLECNFNPKKKTYNPHFHLIVPNKEIADILIREWLSRGTVDFVSSKAQNSRPVRDMERDLIEIIKYGSKIFTEPDLKKKGKKAEGRDIYLAALDVIFRSMKGSRLFERFGFNLPKEDKEQAVISVLNTYEEWSYDLSLADWYDESSGEVLSQYQANHELDDLLKNHIDKSKF